MSPVVATTPPSILGSLGNFENYDSTRHIGTVFPDKSVQLSKFLNAENSDQLLKDLATLVSHRGVVFFKDQDLIPEQQKELADRLGKLAGKPKDSGLHKNPLTSRDAKLGQEVLVLSSETNYSLEGRFASRGWHTDLTFEHVPSDYTILKIHTLPATGGDTLWASGYEAYDKLSSAYKKFVEGLTAQHDCGERLRRSFKSQGFGSVDEPRGSPHNVGTELTAIHPVVRTNPVTGYKSLFVNQTFTKRIIELSPDESDSVLKFLTAVVAENHDLQVRYKWSANDIAMWDNRSTFHTATNDYEDIRVVHRTASVGEKPFFDPASKSRRETLGFKK